MTIPRPPRIKPHRVTDRYLAEVKQQTPRLTGVTPGLLRSFSESPAKFLPRAKGLSLGRKA